MPAHFILNHQIPHSTFRRRMNSRGFSPPDEFSAIRPRWVLWVATTRPPNPGPHRQQGRVGRLGGAVAGRRDPRSARRLVAGCHREQRGGPQPAGRVVVRHVPRPGDRARRGGAWVEQLLSGQSEEQVLGGILASAEFFARAQTLAATGSPQERFAEAVFQSLLGRSNTDPAAAAPPAALASPEYRARTFGGYFTTRPTRARSAAWSPPARAPRRFAPPSKPAASSSPTAAPRFEVPSPAVTCWRCRRRRCRRRWAARSPTRTGTSRSGCRRR